MPFELDRCFAPLPKTKRGRSVVITKDPQHKILLYTYSSQVIIRNAENPQDCDLYRRHTKDASVAKYSPSGYYIASGDASGKVQIWDTVNKDHKMKAEYQALGGTIKDIAWTEDSKRLVIVGEGRGKYGTAIFCDTGTTSGEIIGHSKSINSCDIKQSRPYQVVTGSEDNVAGFHEGPPCKFKCTLKDHTNFVNCVRYSPDGSVFITSSSDGKAFVYDGKTAENIGKLDGGDGKAHKGGIYALAFKPDGTKVATASGDKTVRIWDVASRDLLSTTTIGSAIEDMQLGAIWMDEHYLVTISLAGYLNYINPECPDAPSRIIKGHNSGIYALAPTEDGKTLFTADGSGRIVYWDMETSTSEVMEGDGHSNQVFDMALDGDSLVTVGIDDLVFFSSVSEKKYGNSVKLDSQPQGVATGPNGIVVVACLKEVVLFKNGEVAIKHAVPYAASCAAVSPSGNTVAIGGDDKKTHIYTVEGSKLVENQIVLEHRGDVTAVAFSPDGQYFVATDAGRKTTLYSTADFSILQSDMWAKHTAKINCVAFSPDSQSVVSGSLDTNLVFYDVNKGIEGMYIKKGAHAPNGVSCVGWLDNNTCVSAGINACINIWKRT
ncbi:WD repeat-containing protein 1-like [Lineus longissimus]|uniref:WD repeat-containing protein 1-like n=1 Tax=Lineus longissimus TaxID=88925 RepID=UPI002B4E5B8E